MASVFTEADFTEEAKPRFTEADFQEEAKPRFTEADFSENAQPDLSTIKPSPYQQTVPGRFGESLKPESGMESGTEFTTALATGLPSAIAALPGEAIQAGGRAALGIANLPTDVANRLRGQQPGMPGYVERLEDLPRPSLPRFTGDKYPRLAGVGNVLAQTGEQVLPVFAPPEVGLTLPLLGVNGLVARVGAAAFGYEVLKSLPEEVRQAIATVKDPNASTKDKVEAVGKPAVNSILAALMTHGAVGKASVKAPLEDVRARTGQLAPDVIRLRPEGEPVFGAEPLPLPSPVEIAPGGAVAMQLPPRSISEAGSPDMGDVLSGRQEMQRVEPTPKFEETKPIPTEEAPPVVTPDGPAIRLKSGQVFVGKSHVEAYNKATEAGLVKPPTFNPDDPMQPVFETPVDGGFVIDGIFRTETELNQRQPTEAPPVVTQGAPKAKEPWEMTQKEYEDSKGIEIPAWKQSDGTVLVAGQHEPFAKSDTYFDEHGFFLSNHIPDFAWDLDMKRAGEHELSNELFLPESQGLFVSIREVDAAGGDVYKAAVAKASRLKEPKSPQPAPTEAPPPVVEARPPEPAISEAATANELSQLKREDVKADPRLDMPGITRKAKPNSIIVQLRDLESHPIRDIVLPMSGDVMTDAKTIEDAIRENRVGQNVSLRESLGVTTGPNGRAIHKFGMSPNGMTWTKASDWVDLIDRTKLEREGRTTNVLPSEAATVGKGKEGVRKEPWEMTDVEFMESAKRGKIHKATGTPTPGKPTEADTPISIGEREGYSPDDIAHFYAARRGAYRKGIADSQWFDAINNAREELVRDAIAEGKPVPPEVLDDYPDLQPKAPQPSTPPPPIYKSIEGAKVEVEQPEYVEGKPATYSGRKQLEFSRFFKGKQAGSDQVSVTISQRIKGGKTYDVEHTYYDTPEGQKYPSLQRVRIASDLPLKDAKEAARQWLKSVKDSDNGGKAIMETTPAPPAATGEGMPPGPGAQTAGTDVPPGAQIEQLSQAFRQITAGKTPFLQKVKEAFDLGKKRELSQNLIARTLSALKTSGDYLIQTWQGQRQLDPILRAKGELSAELETRGWRLRQAMKDMKRAVPSKAVREAISKYVDAGGDVEKLRQSAESVPAGRRAPYIRAMQLTPDEKIIAGHIRSFFDARLQEAMDAGVLSHGVEDYLHRIYPKDTTWRRGVINAVQNALLDTRTPGLAKQRVFQLDAEAERAGHLPVNDFIPRIIDYEASLSKVIASRAAVKRFTEIKMPDGRPMLDVSGIGVPIENTEGIREATLIKPSFRPGEKQLDDNGKPTKNYRLDYQSRDYPALKKWKWATNDAEGKPIFVQGDVLVHPDAVHRVDALLEPSKVKRYAAARAALTVGSVFKQTMLDFSGFHQVQIAIHGLEHKVNPFRLVKDVDTNNPDIQGLLKGGMTLGGQHVGGIYEEGLAGRSLSRQIPGLGELMQSYHDWLFQDFIPRVKTTMAIHALERNKARFAKELASGQMKPEALYHQTAKEANAAFGEQNYIMLERSKTAQDMARLILLAPDFLESRARFALQAGTRLGGEQRMALLLGALTLYTTARIMNKAINDEWHFEPENMFSVIYNGKSYSVRTVQGDILHLMESPVRFWMHRLNPTITRPLFELMTQRDEFGRKRSFWQVLGDTISNVVPISMRNSREQSIWTSMLNAFGGAVRRDSDVGRVYQEAAKWKEKNGVRTEPGEFIYDSSKDVYRPLKLALLDGNTEGAAKEYQKLIASKVVTPSQAIRHFQAYANAPFSGSKANEQRFVQSLTKDQRHAYEGAKQEKQRVLREFLKARQLVPGSQGTIPSFVPTVQQR